MENKVLRREYRQLKQAELASFAENVVNRVKGATPYAAVQSGVAALEQCSQTFARALAAARQGGIEQTQAKEAAKKQLLTELDAMANLIDNGASGDSAYIIGAGFRLRSSPQRYTGIIGPPNILRATGTGRSGELRITLEDAVPAIVRMHALEWSEDKGAQWHNGTYDARNNFVASHLPNGREILVRARSIATRGRKSDWSAPVMVAVA